MGNIYTTHTDELNKINPSLNAKPLNEFNIDELTSEDIVIFFDSIYSDFISNRIINKEVQKIEEPEDIVTVELPFMINFGDENNPMFFFSTENLEDLKEERLFLLNDVFHIILDFVLYDLLEEIERIKMSQELSELAEAELTLRSAIQKKDIIRIIDRHHFGTIFLATFNIDMGNKIYMFLFRGKISWNRKDNNGFKPFIIRYEETIIEKIKEAINTGKLNLKEQNINDAKPDGTTIDFNVEDTKLSIYEVKDLSKKTAIILLDINNNVKKIIFPKELKINNEVLYGFELDVEDFNNENKFFVELNKKDKNILLDIYKNLKNKYIEIKNDDGNTIKEINLGSMFLENLQKSLLYEFNKEHRLFNKLIKLNGKINYSFYEKIMEIIKNSLTKNYINQNPELLSKLFDILLQRGNKLPHIEIIFTTRDILKKYNRNEENIPGFLKRLGNYYVIKIIQKLFEEKKKTNKGTNKKSQPYDANRHYNISENTDEEYEDIDEDKKYLSREAINTLIKQPTLIDNKRGRKENKLNKLLLLTFYLADGLIYYRNKHAPKCKLSAVYGYIMEHNSEGKKYRYNSAKEIKGTYNWDAGIFSIIEFVGKNDNEYCVYRELIDFLNKSYSNEEKEISGIIFKAAETLDKLTKEVVAELVSKKKREDCTDELKNRILKELYPQILIFLNDNLNLYILSKECHNHEIKEYFENPFVPATKINGLYNRYKQGIKRLFEEARNVAISNK
ncbi:MAG TPA: hypothetical protein DEP48_07100 [Persephonella sp.]|uniref:Uncharacterized protein n=1 Tax=Persephonella marina (strain DSM 14350 / EX-H1) TaxID=123214 RepID=C0QUA6_PERMH|nr:MULTISPECIES: hypothetical protein [Persephonella]ACO04051.1 conserved hypothetical protein [Persephonella marina EX-H1]HCB70110.1 hypothetical protein [Persephonella sp.]